VLQVGQTSPVGRVEKTPTTNRPRRHRRQKRQDDDLLTEKQLVFQHISTHFGGSSFVDCPLSVPVWRLG
jgi:putative transposon-encoded protein